MWDPTGPGIKPASPALAGRFLSTAPARQPSLRYSTAKMEEGLLEESHRRGVWTFPPSLLSLDCLGAKSLGVPEHPIPRHCLLEWSY